jgi:hypothetical protein
MILQPMTRKTHHLDEDGRASTLPGAHGAEVSRFVSQTSLEPLVLRIGWCESSSVSFNAGTFVVNLGRRAESVAQRYGHVVLRSTAGLLWLSNLNWKVPPRFGRSADGCGGLCEYVEAGSEHELIQTTGWLFEHLVSPNLTTFGWLTIVSETALAAMMISGRFVRFAALLGIAQSIGILAAVANAPNEWYWSYLLMLAVHVGVLATVKDARPQSERATGIIIAGYGTIVALAHLGAGFEGDGNREWSLFSQQNDLPGNFGRDSFPGSIALGLGFLVVGLLATTVSRLDRDIQRRLGTFVTVAAVALFATVDGGGLAIGLGSRTTTACLILALGLSMTFAGTGTDVDEGDACVKSTSSS